MPAWTFRRAKSLDLCGLQRAGTGQVISYPSETQKCCSIVPRDIEKAGKRFLTSYPLFIATCLPAVKLVCFQTFLIGGWQRASLFLCRYTTQSACGPISYPLSRIISMTSGRICALVALTECSSIISPGCRNFSIRSLAVSGSGWLAGSQSL